MFERHSMYWLTFLLAIIGATRRYVEAGSLVKQNAPPVKNMYKYEHLSSEPNTSFDSSSPSASSKAMEGANLFSSHEGQYI